MFKLKLFPALAACLLAIGCTVPMPGGGLEPTPAPSASPTGPASCGLAAGTLVDEKTLYGAETAYNVAAHAYVTADGTGKLPADLKARVKPMLVESYRVLGLARSAYRLGDVCDLNSYAASAKDIAERAKAFLP